MFPNWGSSFDVVNATESYISNFMLQAVSTFPLRLWRKKKIMKTWPMMGSVHMCHTLGSTLSRIFFFYFRNSISLETYWFLHWPSGFNNLFTLKKNGGRCRLTFPSSLVFLKIWQFFLLKLLLQPRKEQYERLDLWLVCGHFLLFFNKSTKIAS